MAKQGPTDSVKKQDSQLLVTQSNALMLSPAGKFVNSPRSGEMKFVEGKEGTQEPTDAQVPTDGQILTNAHEPTNAHETTKKKCCFIL